jgi:hypothetical protein
MRLPADKIRYSVGESLNFTMVLIDATWLQKVESGVNLLGGVNLDTFKNVSSLPVSMMMGA